MSHLARYLLPPVLLISCAYFCLAQSSKPSNESLPPAAEHNPNNWQEFSSEIGGFSVLFPGTPKEDTQVIDVPGGQFKIHRLMLRTFAEYGVIYADYPMPIKDSDTARRVLDDGAKGAVAEVDAQLLSITEISLNGHPGRLLKERFQNGNILRAKMYLVGQRLYQIAVTLPKEDGIPAETIRFHDATATKFLDSFKLLARDATEKRLPQGDSNGDAAGVEIEGEVDRMLKSLREKNEFVIGPCSSDSPCPSMRDYAEAGRIRNGKITRKPAPDYPAVAKAARASGVVLVQVLVSEEGIVLAAQPVSGHPLLLPSAVKAARGINFTPTLLDGKPVKFAGVISYTFELR